MAISSLNTISSSLKAYESALDNSANNIANASTQDYQARQTQFSENAQGGVTVQLSQTAKELNEAGQFAGNNNISNNSNTNNAKNIPSDTDIASELVYSLEYKAGFMLTAKLIDAYKERMGTVIDLFE